jgi:hypothetical protein
MKNTLGPLRRAQNNQISLISKKIIFVSLFTNMLDKIEFEKNKEI